MNGEIKVWTLVLQQIGFFKCFWTLVQRQGYKLFPFIVSIISTPIYKQDNACMMMGIFYFFLQQIGYDDENLMPKVEAEVSCYLLFYYYKKEKNYTTMTSGIRWKKHFSF